MREAKKVVDTREAIALREKQIKGIEFQRKKVDSTQKVIKKLKEDLKKAEKELKGHKKKLYKIEEMTSEEYVETKHCEMVNTPYGANYWMGGDFTNSTITLPPCNHTGTYTFKLTNGE